MWLRANISSVKVYVAYSAQTELFIAIAMVMVAETKASAFLSRVIVAEQNHLARNKFTSHYALMLSTQAFYYFIQITLNCGI